MNVIIAIGSTGVKALESCIHLSNAGLMEGTGLGSSNFEVIIIDKDMKNGAREKSQNLIASLRNTRDDLEGINRNNFPFFKTDFELENWSFDDVINRFNPGVNLFDIVKTTPDDQILLNAIHSRRVQEWNLERGFYGFPNIGATLFKLITETIDKPDSGNEAFIAIRDRLRDGRDNELNLFITGSIFGGTGASIFPNVAQLVRSLAGNNTRVRVGGALVLPYFAVTPNVGEDGILINSEEFLIRTKVALEQYHNWNICHADGNNLFNSLFLIGDQRYNHTGRYANGGAEQDNHFHLVDMYTGYSICDFFNKIGGEGDHYRGVYVAQLATEAIDTCTFANLPTDFNEKSRKMARFSVFLCAMVLPSLMTNSPLNGYLGVAFGRTRFAGKHKASPEERDGFVGKIKEIAKLNIKFLEFLYDLSLNGIDWRDIDERNQRPNTADRNVNLFNHEELNKLINISKQNVRDDATEIRWYDENGDGSINRIIFDEGEGLTLNEIKRSILNKPRINGENLRDKVHRFLEYVEESLENR